jgi:hypothetical protein
VLMVVDRIGLSSSCGSMRTSAAGCCMALPSGAAATKGAVCNRRRATPATKGLHGHMEDIVRLAGQQRTPSTS